MHISVYLFHSLCFVILFSLSPPVSLTHTRSYLSFHGLFIWFSIVHNIWRQPPINQPTNEGKNLEYIKNKVYVRRKINLLYILKKIHWICVATFTSNDFPNWFHSSIINFKTKSFKCARTKTNEAEIVSRFMRKKSFRSTFMIYDEYMCRL